jgi:hypothetical protein
VHLGWLIKKKSVTMHGNMNVKFAWHVCCFQQALELHSLYSFVSGPAGYCGRAIGVNVPTCGHPGSFGDTVITARYLMRRVPVRGSVRGKVDLPVPYPHHSSTGINNSPLSVLFQW